MAFNDKQEKQRQPPKESRIRSSLNVVVEKIGTKSAVVHGDLSKESLKALLMSSLILLPKESLDRSYSHKEKVTPDIPEEVINVTDFTMAKDEQLGSEELKSRRKHIKNLDESSEGKKKDHTQVEKVGLLSGTKADEFQLLARKLATEVRKDVEEDRLQDKRRKKKIDVEINKEEKKLLEKREKEEEKEESIISSDTEGTRLSCDSQWLRENMKEPLIHAMKEIVKIKPHDPVNYLAFWLLNYKNWQKKIQRRQKTTEKLLALRNVFPLLVADVVEDSSYILEESMVPKNGLANWNI